MLRRNVLSLLLCDQKHGIIARELLPVEVWSADHSIFALVNSVYSYIDMYKVVPGEHVFDLIAGLRIKEDQKELLDGLVEYCLSNFDAVNVPYVFSNLDRFHRQTILKDVIHECVGRIAKGEIEFVEDALLTALKKKLQSFNAGSTLPEIMEAIIQKVDDSADYINLGIPALDDRKIHPQRKTLFVWAAPAKGTKSWALIHSGVQGLIEGKKVVHISLEMSEKVVGERYIQAVGSLTKRYTSIKPPPVFDGGHDVSWTTTGQASNGCLLDEPVQDWMQRKLKNSLYSNLIIKEFPTSSLTMNALRGYLDSLEQTEGFVPDLVIVDYADLMKMGNARDSDPRLEVSKIYKELRGMSVERNIMMMTASQINRVGAASKKIDSTHIADDYSKVGTVDNLIIIQRTDEQKEVGMAILHVAAARNDESGWSMFISQKLATGQWCLTSSDKLDEQFIEKVNAFTGITVP